MSLWKISLIEQAVEGLVYKEQGWTSFLGEVAAQLRPLRRLLSVNQTRRLRGELLPGYCLRSIVMTDGVLEGAFHMRHLPVNYPQYDQRVNLKFIYLCLVKQDIKKLFVFWNSNIGVV